MWLPMRQLRGRKASADTVSKMGKKKGWLGKESILDLREAGLGKELTSMLTSPIWSHSHQFLTEHHQGLCRNWMR